MNKIQLGQGMPDIQLVESDELVVGYVVVDFEDEQLMPLAAAGLTLEEMLTDLIGRVERARDIVTNQQGVFSSLREHLAHIEGAIAQSVAAKRTG
jgi:hypothetical protein|tara:strand:- start:1499 stop:1783 length:285 start_codon:yes stop_codon:yes gene_type:complete